MPTNMSDDRLVPVFIPSLAALLLNRENAKAAPLTREEIVAVRDDAQVIMMGDTESRELETKRGYPDVDPEDCWREWQRLRLTIGIPPAGTELPDDPALLLGRPWLFGRLPEDGGGVEVAFDDDARVTTIWLTQGTLASRFRPRGAALLGITRQRAAELLRSPTKSSGSWDRFDEDEVGLHLEYTETVVTRVTLMWIPSLGQHLR